MTKMKFRRCSSSDVKIEDRRMFFLESIGNTIEPVFKPSHTLYEILKYALLSTNYYYKSIKQV